jgi:hypothetical protein
MDLRSKITAFTVIMIFLLTFLTGCTSLRSVQLNQSFWQERGKRVAVALEVVGPPEVIMDISGGLGQMTNSSSIPIESPDAMEYPNQFHNTMPLYSASKTLDGKAFDIARDLLIQGLKERGLDAFNVEGHIEMEKLPRFTGDRSDGTYENMDFSRISKSIGADYIILMDIKYYGMICRYLGLDLLGVDVYADIRGEMIEASTNRILWRTGLADGYLSRTVDVTSTQPDQIKTIFDGMDKLLIDASKNISQKFFERNQ